MKTVFNTLSRVVGLYPIVTAINKISQYFLIVDVPSGALWLFGSLPLGYWLVSAHLLRPTIHIIYFYVTTI